MSDELQCFRCHGGPFFDQPLAINGTLEAEPGYFNTGLYNVDGEGGYPSSAQGLYALTGDPSNMGQFRTPSLRNVSVTGPWGHDGSFASLENVIQAYARGGRLVQSGANAGDGALNQWKDARIQGFEISPSEVSDLIAFLHTLTDEAMLDKPEYADPFCRDAETDQIDCIRPFIMD